MTHNVLWQAVKSISVAAGLICLLIAVSQVVIDHEERVGCDVQVGMTRQEVEARLRGWHVGRSSFYPAMPRMRQEDCRYWVRYRGSWWRTYVYYDAKSRVVRSEVCDWM